MKKICKNLSLLLAVAALSSAVYTPKAQAYSIISILGTGYVVDLTPNRATNVLLCVLFLPICLLGDKTGPGTFDAAVLEGQYSDPAHRAAIVRGQEAATAYLSTAGGDKSVKWTTAQFIEAVSSADGITREYVQYLRDNL